MFNYQRVNHVFPGAMFNSIEYNYERVSGQILWLYHPSSTWFYGKMCCTYLLVHLVLDIRIYIYIYIYIDSAWGPRIINSSHISTQALFQCQRPVFHMARGWKNPQLCCDSRAIFCWFTNRSNFLRMSHPHEVNHWTHLLSYLQHCARPFCCLVYKPKKPVLQCSIYLPRTNVATRLERKTL